MVENFEFDPVVICAKIQSGDSTAETALIQRFSESLIFMLVQRTRDKQLSDDLHQDTFRIVLERLRSDKGISDPSKLSGFVHRTAINVCIDHARKTKRRKTHTDSGIFEYLPDHRATQLDKVIQEERIGLVRDIIDKLNVSRDRELMHRFYVLEQDKAQICDHFAMSSDNFDRVISRARKRFKQAIEKRMRELNVDEI